MFIDPNEQSYRPCRYGGVKLEFRGPKRDLKDDYVAFLGGTETYGKFVDAPFPQLLEEQTDIPCINLGLPNAGVDVLLNEAGIAEMASGARLTILQVPCAIGMNNKFYKVHPRRNDRFLGARQPLKELFPEVDFTEFSFARHMLSNLRHVSKDRFFYVRKELAQRWVVRMRRLLGRIEGPVVLLWFSGRTPEDHFDDPEIRFQPSLVNRAMLNVLNADVANLIEFDTANSDRADDVDTEMVDKVFSLMSKHVVRDLPGQKAHDRAAEALIPAIEAMLKT
ncbi:MAG: DUF6473 family protein [Pseudomonadota bacterium]